MKYNCSVCDKETSIETFDGVYKPLCYQHYMDYLNSSEYILKTTVKEALNKLIERSGKMSGFDEAVERLKKEGYSYEEIQEALRLMIEETRTGEVIADIDEYLNTLEDE